MNQDAPTHLTSALIVAGPLALLAAGFLPSALVNRDGRRSARFGAALSLAVLLLSLAAAAVLPLRGPVAVAVDLSGPFQIGIHFDRLAAVVLVLVAFLLAVVTRYSVQYLDGDPRQGDFSKWLCATGGAVLLMVVSGNLVQFALAWSATSLGLHRLLLFRADRPAAVLAARKKFLISRLGDVCLVSVIALVHLQYETWNFSELFAAADATRGVVGGGAVVGAICFLLVACAMLKSAQFPFHSWLPDTMETPTPVSALMHAGIINAGGYLIIRLSPLVTLSQAAMSTLALFGAFTALFASLVMLTHASVKRSLAFSTVAQMGFMMLQCGLGAFSLAVLHLIAHSLYKAHAFLSSGSIVSLAKAAWAPTEKPNAHPLTLTASFAAAIVLAFGGAWVFGVDVRIEPGVLVLGGTFTMALGYVLWNFWCQSRSWKLALVGGLMGGGLVAAYCLLHKVFGNLIVHGEWTNPQLTSGSGIALIAVLLTLFFLVLVLQTELPQWIQRPGFQALYVHARNGFYFTTLANRLVAALWSPRAPALNKPNDEPHA